MTTQDSGVRKLYRRDNQPFAQIPNEAIRDPQITASAFRLLAYLMSHQDGYELTYGQIERETGMGRYAINEAIKNLTSRGWLMTEATKMPDGRFGPKSWTVLNPTGAGFSTAGDSTTEKPTDNKKTTSLEEQDRRTVNPQAALEDEFFAKFWEFYPRKVDKLAARKAYTKAVKVAGFEAVHDGARRLAEDPNLPPKQFVPYPASWLNAGGWTNEPYPERERTKEELEAIRAEQYRRQREVELAEAAKRREEAKRQEEYLAANPVTRCEHDRVKVICPICSKNVPGTN